jgi:hypothetical protein
MPADMVTIYALLSYWQYEARGIVRAAQDGRAAARTLASGRNKPCCNEIIRTFRSRIRTPMLTRRRNPAARTEDAGDKPTVSQVALIRSLAGFCGGLAVLTIFWPDWIEALTGYDPDQHDGTVEGLIVIALLSSAPYWRARRGRARRPAL